MTDDEFNKQVSLLRASFPHRWPDPRVAAFYKHVKDLDAKWFAKFVEDMILKLDDRVNITEHSSHRRALERKDRERKNSTAPSLEQKHDGKPYLEKLGFKSFSDYLKNKNKMPLTAKGEKNEK